jgi:hypothetical protein
VHDPAGIAVTTFVETTVLTVCVPEQLLPRVAPVQVYVSASPAVGGVAMHGPPDAQTKSVDAFTVMLAVPIAAVVRARYWIVSVPV